VFDVVKLKCICPDSAPYEFNRTCISCDTSSFWNDASKQCLKCPLNTINIPGKGCQCPAATPALDALTNTCKSCPTSTPFWNGNQCINCAAGSSFSSVTLSCTVCSPGTTFNSKTNQC